MVSAEPRSPARAGGPIAIIAAAFPAATVQATSHPVLPALIGSVANGADVLLVQDDVLVIDSGPGRTFAFRGPAGSALAELRLWVNDGCDINGRTTVWGANGSGLPVTVRSADPGVPIAADFAIPAGDPGEPVGFLMPDPLSCDALVMGPAGPFETLEGTLFFDGRTQRCGDFQADAAFRQSKRGDDLDLLTLRDSQHNRIINENPIVTIDESKAYDEAFLLLGDPFAGSEGEVPRLEGVAIGGGPGTVPKRGRLQKRIDRIPPAELVDLVRKSIDRADQGKKVAPLLKRLGADPNACTYHVELELDEDANPDSVQRLAAASRPSLQDLPVDDRFQVQVSLGDTTTTEVDLAGLASRSAIDPTPLYFFDDDGWETLIKIVDACESNEHFWVFAAATTGVEFTLDVTDTETGEARVYEVPGAPAEAVTDTTAFATCP